MDHQTQIKVLHNLSLFIIGLIIGIVLLSNCEGKEPIKSDISNKDTVRIYNVKVDSVEVIRTKLITKWRTNRDTINIHDTIEVINALNLCDTIIKTDSTQIAYLRVINRNFATIVYNDSLIIDSLKTSKKKYFKGFKHGLIAGSVGASLIFGSIILK